MVGVSSLALEGAYLEAPALEVHRPRKHGHPVEQQRREVLRDLDRVLVSAAAARQLVAELLVRHLRHFLFLRVPTTECIIESTLMLMIRTVQETRYVN